MSVLKRTKLLKGVQLAAERSPFRWWWEAKKSRHRLDEGDTCVLLNAPRWRANAQQLTTTRNNIQLGVQTDAET